jgi:hypothetical protein
MEDGIRLALARKRRMRLIYKWRHGLARTCQPKRGDRGKLDRLRAYECLRLDPLMERVLSPYMKRLAKAVADQIMGGQ